MLVPSLIVVSATNIILQYFSYPRRQNLSTMSTTTTKVATTPGLQTPQLKELHASFGAEITGLSFANGVTTKGQKIILDAVIKVNS